MTVQKSTVITMTSMIWYAIVPYRLKGGLTMALGRLLPFYPYAYRRLTEGLSGPFHYLTFNKMESQEKTKPVRSFKYQRAERIGRKVYYQKLCLHCNGKYESRRMDSAFCCYRCAKASRRMRVKTYLTVKINN